MAHSYFNDKEVAVLGGTGLIGMQLVAQLAQLGARVNIVARHPATFQLPQAASFRPADILDARSCAEAIRGADTVFNLAVYGGGILRNTRESAHILTTNLLMQTHVIEAVRECEVERYLFPSSVYAYPGKVEIMKEDLAWEGPPDKTHEGFGWAKRIGEMQCRLYAEEYGIKIAIVRPTNTYGPMDNFDLKSSHVVPALVRKAVERQDPYVVWGSGAARRELIYSGDVARGMILALDKYAVADPVNLGSGQEISIADLTGLILELAGHTPSKIVFDESRPAGQMRRVCDTRKASEVLGFTAEIRLKTGLGKTIDWFKQESKVAARA